MIARVRCTSVPASGARARAIGGKHNLQAGKSDLIDEVCACLACGGQVGAVRPPLSCKAFWAFSLVASIQRYTAFNKRQQATFTSDAAESCATSTAKT